MPLTLKELMAGDHIYVKRRRYFYTHHGIYAGNGQVVHFKGAVKEKKDPAVIITDIDTFLNNGKLRKRNYRRRLPHAATLKMAKEHLARKGYSLVFNNCEHFATYCTTGKKKSKQVNRVIGGLTTVTVALAGILIRKKTGVKKKNPDIF